MENDVFALIFFLSLIWCRYGAAELAPGLPVLAGSSAPGLATPPGRACPYDGCVAGEGRPWAGRASGERAHRMAAQPGAPPLDWPRLRGGRAPWDGCAAGECRPSAGRAAGEHCPWDGRAAGEHCPWAGRTAGSSAPGLATPLGNALSMPFWHQCTGGGRPVPLSPPVNRRQPPLLRLRSSSARSFGASTWTTTIA